MKNNPAVDTFLFNPTDTARETPYYFGVDPVSQSFIQFKKLGNN